MTIITSINTKSVSADATRTIKENFDALIPPGSPDKVESAPVKSEEKPAQPQSVKTVQENSALDPSECKTCPPVFNN